MTRCRFKKDLHRTHKVLKVMTGLLIIASIYFLGSVVVGIYNLAEAVL